MKQSELYPSHGHIEPTLLCNLRCKTCISPIFDKKGNIHLSLKDIGIIIKKIPSVNDVSLLGRGEPLLNPEIIDIAEYIKSRGIRLRIATNGMLLDKIDIKRMVQSVDEIIISFDSPDKDNFERLREGASYEKVIGNIDNLLQTRESTGSKVNIALNTVISALNYNYLHDMPLLGKDMNIDTLKFTMAVSYIPAKDMDKNSKYKNKYNDIKGLILKDKDKEDDLLFLLKENCERYGINCRISDSSKKYKDCWWPKNGINITYNGYVTPCCLRMDPHIINFGNILKTPFSEIWNGDDYQYFKESFLNGECPLICRDCP